IQAIGSNKNKFNLEKRAVALVSPLTRIFFLNTGKSNVDEILYPCNFLPGNNSTKINWVVLLVVLVPLATYFSRKEFWKNEDRKLLFVFSLAYLIPFVFLPSIGSVEYYLLGFFPMFVLMIAFVIESLSKWFRFITYIFLIIFVIY